MLIATWDFQHKCSKVGYLFSMSDRLLNLVESLIYTPTPPPLFLSLLLKAWVQPGIVAY